MPRRYKVDYVGGAPVVYIPTDDESIFPPTVYICDNCGTRFYTLQSFVDHLLIKHKIPPSQAWRFVKPKEVR